MIASEVKYWLRELKVSSYIYENSKYQIVGVDFARKRIEESIDFALNCIDIATKSNADGCKGCAFEDVEEWEMPCAKCKRKCKDYWRKKEKK